VFGPSFKTVVLTPIFICISNLPIFRSLPWFSVFPFNLEQIQWAGQIDVFGHRFKNLTPIFLFFRAPHFSEHRYPDFWVCLWILSRFNGPDDVLGQSFKTVILTFYFFFVHPKFPVIVIPIFGLPSQSGADSMGHRMCLDEFSPQWVGPQIPVVFRAPQCSKHHHPDSWSSLSIWSVFNGMDDVSGQIFKTLILTIIFFWSSTPIEHRLPDFRSPPQSGVDWIGWKRCLDTFSHQWFWLESFFRASLFSEHHHPKFRIVPWIWISLNEPKDLFW